MHWSMNHGGLRLGAVAALLAASSYAGLAVGRNTVGSPQVKNNSLTGQDIKNGSLKQKDLSQGSVATRQLVNGGVERGDLAPGAAAEVYSFEGFLTAGAPAVQILEVPEGLTASASCNTGLTENILFTIPARTDRALVSLSAHDLVDNAPVGGVAISGFGGGVGFGSAGITIFEGQVWAQFPSLRLHGDFSIGAASGGVCHARVLITAERLATPVPLPKQAPGKAGCQAIGAGAYCLTPAGRRVRG